MQDNKQFESLFGSWGSRKKNFPNNFEKLAI